MSSSTTSNRHPALAACESNSADARRSFAQAKLDARLQPLLQQQQARKPKKPIRVPTLGDGSPSHAQPLRDSSKASTYKKRMISR